MTVRTHVFTDEDGSQTLLCIFDDRMTVSTRPRESASWGPPVQEDRWYRDHEPRSVEEFVALIGSLYEEVVSELQEPWQQQEGEPQIKVTVTPAGAIVVQSLALGLTAALVMRPEVAIWLGEQLQLHGTQVKSGLVIPRGVVPPNGRPS